MRPLLITAVLAIGLSPGVSLLAQAERPLVMVNSIGDLTSIWAVSVWPSGKVQVENNLHPHLAGSYSLAPRELAELRAILERERPWELSGALGDLVVHGPRRVVEVNDGTRRSGFRLYTTPAGFAAIYEADSSGLGRALRVCEALWALARDADLPHCVDGE